MKRLVSVLFLGSAFSSTAYAKYALFCNYEHEGWNWRTAQGGSIDGLCSGGRTGEQIPPPWETTKLVTNNSSSKSIWVTIYDLGETQQLDWGCVSAKGTRTWASGPYLWGSFYKIRAEVKENADCTGETFSDTKYQVNPQFILSKFPQELVSTLVFGGEGYYWVNGDESGGPFGVAPKLPDLTPVVIQSRVDGTQVLSVDKTNPECRLGGKDKSCSIIITDYKSGDPAQIWERYYQATGMAFRNRLTGMLLTADGSSGATTLVSPSVVNGGSGWTLGGNCNSSCALRPWRNSDLNLNVLGSGPYKAGNAVGTWGWNGGSPNETWFFIEPEIKPVVIYSRILDSKVLSVDKSNPNCVSGGKEKSCPIVIDDYRQGDLAQVWDRVYQNGGLSLQNRYTGMLLWVENGNGARATLVNPSQVDEGSVWSIGGDCNSNCALRPMRDFGQNLNVFGGAPYKAGNPVGTWGWDGGTPNETWFFGNAPK